MASSSEQGAERCPQCGSDDKGNRSLGPDMPDSAGVVWKQSCGHPWHDAPDERDKFEVWAVRHLGDERFLLRDERLPEKYDAYLMDHLWLAYQAGLGSRGAAQPDLEAIALKWFPKIPWPGGYGDDNSTIRERCLAAMREALQLPSRGKEEP